MLDLKVFEINLYYLIVAKKEEEAVSFFHQLTGERVKKIRECNVEKEGYVIFNEKTYKMNTYQAMLEDLINQQKNVHYPFLLRSKS